VIEYSRGQLEALSGGIIQLAQAEKLDAHANAVRIRFSEEG
jgi:histidinol dehydrogenase